MNVRLLRSALPRLLIRSLYSKTVTNYFRTPRNVGSLDRSKQSVDTGLVGSPACGDVMKLQIEVDNGMIVETRFKTFGCGSAIASSSYGSTYIKGKRLDEAKRLTNTDIARHLDLPPIKLHCSMLMEDAIRAAIQDYERKQ